jgi:hypothetical protein
MEEELVLQIFSIIISAYSYFGLGGNKNLAPRRFQYYSYT